MRIAKVPAEVVIQKVWASLCERMDPETKLVRPSWIKLMHEVGVCRQRIADAIRALRDEDKIESVTLPRPESARKHTDHFYKVHLSPGAQ